MVSITFEPSDSRVTFTLPLEDSGSQPQNGSTARLSWRITPMGPKSVRLADGGTLAELEGMVFVAVGNAGPDGKTLLEGTDVPSWGALWYFKSDSYNVHVYVSQALFERLLRLIELAKVPDLEIEFPLRSPVKYGQGGEFITWDSAGHERVIFAHGTFVARF